MSLLYRCGGSVNVSFNATVYGAPNETVTIVSDSDTYTLKMSSSGYNTIKLPKGTYDLAGNISGQTFNSQKLTKDSTYLYCRHIWHIHLHT